MQIFNYPFSIFNYFLYLCSRIMENEENSINWKAMYRRWCYMLIAIAAAAFLFTRPVFSFQEDKGIIYVRSFSMTQTEFVVTQTELATGAKQVVDTMPIKGLYYCNEVILWGTILCFLCFFKPWRIWVCNLTAIACGVYYCIMIYYAIQMSDIHYATLYPNLMAIVPAVILEMMIITRHNVINVLQEEADAAV